MRPGVDSPPSPHRMIVIGASLNSACGVHGWWFACNATAKPTQMALAIPIQTERKVINPKADEGFGAGGWVVPAGDS